MRKNRVIPAVVLLILSTVCFAGKYPQLKPGLWETQGNMMGGMKKITQCIDAKTLAESEKQADEFVKASCNNIKDSQSGNVYTTEMNCKMEGGKVSQQKTVTTVVSVNEIQSKTTTVVDGKTSVMQSRNKRLGDCAKDDVSITDKVGSTQSLEALIKQAKESQKKH